MLAAIKVLLQIVVTRNFMLLATFFAQTNLSASVHTIVTTYIWIFR